MGTTIEIQAADGAAEAYLTGEDGRPGVLLFVDAIGLRQQTGDMADRIACWGYTVLVPHVFYRDGWPPSWPRTGDLREAGAREAFFASGVMDRVGALTAERAAADAEAWMATLLEHAGDGPVGMIGYCMGARLALRPAGSSPAPSAPSAASTAAAWSPTSPTARTWPSPTAPPSTSSATPTRTPRCRSRP